MSIYKQLTSTVLQKISDLRGESSTNTDAVRIRFLSSNNQDISKRRKWNIYHRRLSSQAGDGTSDYSVGDATYPCKLKGVTEIFIGGTTEDKRYSIVSYDEYTVQYNNNASAKIAYEYFDATNDIVKIHVNATPAASETIYISYYWIPPTLTATTDYVITPDINILIYMTLADIDDNEDGEDGDDLRNKAEIFYNEASGIEDGTNTGQLIQMASQENLTSPKGVGSY